MTNAEIRMVKAILYDAEELIKSANRVIQSYDAVIGEYAAPVGMPEFEKCIEQMGWWLTRQEAIDNWNTGHYPRCGTCKYYLNEPSQSICTGKRFHGCYVEPSDGCNHWMGKEQADEVL